MRLPEPFYRLPVTFDVGRLLTEARAFEPYEWKPDRINVLGYSSINLVSFLGSESESYEAPMEGTAALEHCPYVKQILSGFDTVWAEVRLRKLETDVEVPTHYDSSFQALHRMRIHIPILTDESVLFICDDYPVHMRAGEAWVFDRTRPHSIRNSSSRDRIHLVADTVGSSRFWQLLSAAEPFGPSVSRPVTPPRRTRLEFRGADSSATLRTERTPCEPILDPGALEDFFRLLLPDWKATFDSGDERSSLLERRVESFLRDWRCAWTEHGCDVGGWPRYRELAEEMIASARSLGAADGADIQWSPWSRFVQFIRTAAFASTLGKSALQPRSSLQPDTPLLLPSGVRGRISVTGRWELWIPRLGAYRETTPAEVNLLSHVGAGATVGEVTSDAGYEVDAALYLLLDELLDAAVLLVQHHEAIVLNTGELKRPPASASEDRISKKRQPSARSRARPGSSAKTQRLCLRDDVHFRVSNRAKGELWLWVPRLGEHRIVSHTLLELVGEVARVCDVDRAASAVGIPCGRELEPVIDRLIELGLAVPGDHHP